MPIKIFKKCTCCGKIITSISEYHIVDVSLDESGEYVYMFNCTCGSTLIVEV